jgi:hypothetical protein
MYLVAQPSNSVYIFARHSLTDEFFEIGNLPDGYFSKL